MCCFARLRIQNNSWRRRVRPSHPLSPHDKTPPYNTCLRLLLLRCSPAHARTTHEPLPLTPGVLIDHIQSFAVCCFCFETQPQVKRRYARQEGGAAGPTKHIRFHRSLDWMKEGGREGETHRKDTQERTKGAWAVRQQPTYSLAGLCSSQSQAPQQRCRHDRHVSIADHPRPVAAASRLSGGGGGAAARCRLCRTAGWRELSQHNLEIAAPKRARLLLVPAALAAWEGRGGGAKGGRV